MANSSSVSPKPASLGPLLIGAALGGIFWLVIGHILLFQFVGVQWVVGPENVSSPASVPIMLRSMQHWINLFTLMAFGAALASLAARWRFVNVQSQKIDESMLSPDDQTLLLPEDALQLRQAMNQPNQTDPSMINLLLGTALQRARANWSAEDVSAALESHAEIIQAETESQYATIRYLAWAIPSIGFVGTVMGIGEAMGVFGQDAEGESLISAAAGHLSTAFDTTFVALVLSLILMYFVHRVQADEDSLLVRVLEACMKRFVHRMHIKKE